MSDIEKDYTEDEETAKWNKVSRVNKSFRIQWI